MSPTIGGHKGGVIVNITGSGFPLKGLDRVSVYIGDSQAKVVFVSN